MDIDCALMFWFKAYRKVAFDMIVDEIDCRCWFLVYEALIIFIPLSNWSLNLRVNISPVISTGRDAQMPFNW